MNLLLQFSASKVFWGVHLGHKQPFFLTYNGHMDLIGTKWRLTGQRDGRIGGEVANHPKAPKLAAHLLHSHALDCVKQINKNIT